MSTVVCPAARGEFEPALSGAALATAFALFGILVFAASFAIRQRAPSPATPAAALFFAPGCVLPIAQSVANLELR